ncbi:MAG: leucine dehydrogenase [Flavobacteriales bacterium]|nr:leucine dehydrogenase [Flavobacteriales bacterium]|tara:strand:+ start:35908 stop:36996 length:1089 start_codon:yes stop_codon:yes gene_type:complete
MKTIKKSKKFNEFEVLDGMGSLGHEQILFCQDKETGLKAIIAIHDTTLGPALGGTRMWNYENEQDAVRDVLRLSRGMTFKAAISGLSLGGGKAVIIGDSKKDKTERLMRKFGQFVDTLGGKYITAEDVGMTPKDMEYVRMETKHVTGIPQSMGGSGDPSPVTAFGVYVGMKASAKYKWGNDSLKNKIVLVQGVGHVGETLVKYLSDEGANVIINDLDINRLENISKKFNSEIVTGDSIYDLDIDIYAPCALGGTVNPDTINRLKCAIIAGAANNQLENESRDAKLCLEKGICYAPDFLINAGGLINVYSEIHNYDMNHALNQTRKIYDTTLEIFRKAELNNITTNDAALQIANKIVQEKKIS